MGRWVRERGGRWVGGWVGGWVRERWVGAWVRERIIERDGEIESQ